MGIRFWYCLYAGKTAVLIEQNIEQNNEYKFNAGAGRNGERKKQE